MSQIDVIKENVQYEQLLRESTGSNILKGEYLIKDSHPDVHEILGVDAKATVAITAPGIFPVKNKLGTTKAPTNLDAVRRLGIYVFLFFKVSLNN